MPNAFQFRSLLGMPPKKTNGDTHSNARPDSDAPAAPSRASRSQAIRENLEMLMNQVEHAKRDADQMMEEMSALEIDASMATSLRRENDALREQLDDCARETMAEAAKSEGAAREINRLKEEITRIRADYEKSQCEASANKLDAERIEDRLRAAIASLEETKRDLEIQREAKDKAEVDAACLRANLAERDRAQSNLLQQETELRMQANKLQAQYEEVAEALARKERSVIEKASQVESQKDRIADLEADAQAARDELRILGNKYADLKVSQESRLYSLNDGLNQERESHQMTRKLLEEARDSNELLSDEIAMLKDQGHCATKDQQRAQRELSAARTQVREYGDKLKEAHLRLAAAEGDIQRLEKTLEETRKDAMTLRRQASKSDQLLRENTDLHDKVAGLQLRLEKYRGHDMIEEIPVMLSSAKRSPAPSSSSKKEARPRVTTAGQNVARIARR